MKNTLNIQQLSMLKVNNLLNRGIFNIPLLLCKKYTLHYKCCQQFYKKV